MTVLVTDLDGTLSRTDTLHEAVLRLVATEPATLLKLPGWVLQGRAGFKARIADHCVISGEDLPLNEVVIYRIAEARAAGRRTMLVSAADQRQADAVAAKLKLFDEVCGSSSKLNLKGCNKAQFLVERYGDRGFDYIGDALADIPVWTSAARALTVQAGPALRLAAEEANPFIEHLDPPAGRTKALWDALRPAQWWTNLLVFAPLFVVQDFSATGQVLMGFVAFCLAASAGSVLEDLLCLIADRRHPRKRHRPFASGSLSAATGVLLMAGTSALGALFAVATSNLAFIWVFALFLFLALFHPFFLKRTSWLDMPARVSLYALRLLAGTAVVGISLSSGF